MSSSINVCIEYKLLFYIQTTFGEINYNYTYKNIQQNSYKSIISKCFLKENVLLNYCIKH
jgi:hypothetical protein